MNHILLGPEEGLKADWLSEEKKRVLSLHPDAEIYQIFVGDDRGEDLDSVLSQATLFSSFRFVMIKQYENRTGKDTYDKAILDFLASGQDDAEFVILSSEKSKAKINPRIANDKNVSIQIFWEMFDNQKRDWITAAFAKEGYRIGEEAIDEILFSVDNNTADMKNLVSALSLFFHATDPSKTEIRSEDVEKYSLQTRGEDGNTLFQAIADMDLERAEAIASSIMNSDNQGMIKAYSVIVSKFRMLESFEKLRSSGMNEKSAFDNADALSPYPVFYPTKGIKARDQAVFRKAAKNYPAEDTSRIIKYLAAMDNRIKNTSSEWMRIVVSSFLSDIIIRKGRESRMNLDSSPLEISI